MEYMTAGESHGEQMTGIIMGIPAGLEIDVDKINLALSIRQNSYGRGKRQKIENDEVRIVSGIRGGITLGSPISVVVKNKDHKNWLGIMETNSENIRYGERYASKVVTCPRPGHADLVGGMKYGHRDLRNVLERSSARETVLKVAIGSICEQLLRELKIDLIGYVTQVGNIKIKTSEKMSVGDIRERINDNDLRIIDKSKISEIHKLITQTKRKGDTLGGKVRVLVENLPVGLGNYTSWEKKLDVRLAGAVMGVNAIKGVSFGDGFDIVGHFGSEVMDEITYKTSGGYTRKTNHLGGIEGGMTNGMPLIVDAALKPIPTLRKPLETIDIETKKRAKASIERADITVVAPASLIVENVIAIELVRTILETFESSNLSRLKVEVENYRNYISKY